MKPITLSVCGGEIVNDPERQADVFPHQVLQSLDNVLQTKKWNLQTAFGLTCDSKLAKPRSNFTSEDSAQLVKQICF